MALSDVSLRFSKSAALGGISGRRAGEPKSTRLTQRRRQAAMRTVDRLRPLPFNADEENEDRLSQERTFINRQRHKISLVQSRQNLNHNEY